MNDHRRQQNLMRYASVGVEFLVVFLLFLAGGWALDNRLGTQPGFTGLGGLVGFGVAFYRITRQGWGIMQHGNRGRRDDEDDDVADDI